MATMVSIMADTDLVQKRVLDGPLDVHPSKNAVVLHYRVEAVALSEYGEPMIADSKDCKKVIIVKGLTGGVDIEQLARHVVSQCPLIKPTRLPEVQQLLVYLKNRKQANSGFQDDDALQASSIKIQKQMDDLEVPSEKATMTDLDSYLEMLYEDIPTKIKGTGLILQLARVPDNLIELIKNESQFSALSRVLRDDWKKSIDLSTNIIYIFFCFSTFSDFHTKLAQHKVGSMCMLVLEHEIKRYQSLQEDLAAKRKDCGTDPLAKAEYDKLKKKHSQLMKKQETLLRVTLYLLLNLAENTQVEQKMRNRGLLSHLMTLLDRDSQELLILVVSFLKKLSIFAENKNDMASEGVMKKLVKLIPCENEILMNVTLRLLLNLSFDVGLRLEMVKVGLLPKFVALLSADKHRKTVLCILYHLSIDEKSRAVFVYTDCVQMVMKLILECSDDQVIDAETLALAINLACNSFIAQTMCKGAGLKLLLRRALKSCDPLLMKVIRNIACHEGPTKRIFLSYISDLGQAMKSCADNEDLLLEIMGIMSSLTMPEIDYDKILTELQLLPLLLTKMKDPATRDDLVLEAIRLCATLAADEKCAVKFAEVGMSEVLIGILKAKQEDDEIVLQIVFLFHQLVVHGPSRNNITKGSSASEYLLELMNDKNKAISSLCYATLDLLALSDKELAAKLQFERFQWHNFQWLEMMTGKALLKDEDLDEDYLDPHVLHTAADLFDSPELYYELQYQLENANGRPLQAGNPITSDEHQLLDEYASAMYGVPSSMPMQMGFMAENDLDEPGAVDGIESNEHPAFSMLSNVSNQVPLKGTLWRPPSRAF